MLKDKPSYFRTAFRSACEHTHKKFTVGGAVFIVVFGVGLALILFLLKEMFPDEQVAPAMDEIWVGVAGGILGLLFYIGSLTLNFILAPARIYREQEGEIKLLKNELKKKEDKPHLKIIYDPEIHWTSTESKDTFRLAVCYENSSLETVTKVHLEIEDIEANEKAETNKLRRLLKGKPLCVKGSSLYNLDYEFERLYLGQNREFNFVTLHKDEDEEHILYTHNRKGKLGEPIHKFHTSRQPISTMGSWAKLPRGKYKVTLHAYADGCRFGRAVFEFWTSDKSVTFKRINEDGS